MLASIIFQAALILVSLFCIPECDTTGGYVAVGVFLAIGPLFLCFETEKEYFSQTNKVHSLFCVIVVLFCNLDAHVDRSKEEQRKLEKMLMAKAPSFHFDSNSGLLSEEELQNGWGGVRYTAGSLKYNFSFTDPETLALREFILANKELCIVGVGREYFPGFVRWGFDILWSVPQAWWHFRKDTCRIGIAAGHGNGYSLNLHLGEDLFAGEIQEKKFYQSKLKEDYRSISLLFIQCRGVGEPKDDGLVYEENGYYYSSEMGRETRGDWLYEAFHNGELQRLVQKIKRQSLVQKIKRKKIKRNR